MRISIILPALALAACSPGAQSDTPGNAAQNSAEPAANSADNATNYSEAVLKLNDAQRNATFIRALIDSSLPCESVKESVRVDDFNGSPTWRATCTGGENYMISIQRDGIARVLSRSDR